MTLSPSHTATTVKPRTAAGVFEDHLRFISREDSDIDAAGTRHCSRSQLVARNIN